jgi:hypothetical protein
MSEKEEKYSQLILKTDGTYEILIEEGVSVSCSSKKLLRDLQKIKILQ